MQTDPATISPLPRDMRLALGLLAAIVLVPAATMLWLNRPLLAILPLLTVPAVWLVTTPRVTLYLFLLSLGVYMPYYTGSFAVHPMDVALALLAVGVVLEFLLRGQTEIRHTGIDRAYLFLIGATILSAIFAYNYRLSIVPVLRIITLYIAFRVLFKFALEVPIRRLLEFYLALIFVLSLITTGQLIATGGALRVFGPAWLAMQYLTMVAVPVTICFFVWSDNPWQKLRYTVYVLFMVIAILATQSRAPVVAVAAVVPLLLVVLYWRLRRDKLTYAYRNLRAVIFVAGLAGLVIVTLAGTLFAGAFDRIAEFIASWHQPKGTVALRLVLWSAALEAFAENVLFGVGIGNFRVVHEILPHLKLNPTWRWVQGMSAHNVILHYLAETGLVGTIALLTVAVSGARMALRTAGERLSTEQMPVAMALFAMMLTFVITLLYMRAWTWEQSGYLMSFIFALNTAWRYKRDRA
ncbi:hypothetical protein GF420_14280 [candidate division GN15 bacterium]|nr:hypothetical protein [candidate division GN15 bacterium]